MARDSKIQREILQQLNEQGVEATGAIEHRYLFNKDDSWPWKKKGSHRPTADIVIPKPRIYVEVKGFMTLFAMAKLRWLSNQGFAYYVFQATEPRWNPWLESPLTTPDIRTPEMRVSEQKRLIQQQQIAELVQYVAQHNLRNDELLRISEISRLRLQDYFHRTVGTYRDWNGECP
jgi:hypothetical protein